MGLHVTLTNEDAELLFDVAGCRGELDRQLERFERLLGRAPTHLDSHHNVHLEQPLSDLFEEVARERDLPLRAFSPGALLRGLLRAMGRGDASGAGERRDTAARCSTSRSGRA